MTGKIEISSLTKRQTVISILIIGLLFFIFGFVSWVNAILIPYFKIACELNNFQSYFVAFAFYISYFIMSVPSSYLLRKLGFKKGMMAGFWTMAAGAFIFIPAAYTRTYGLFLLGLFTIGTGLSILQSAANPYITVLGPKERAAQRISIMGICNKGAGILAPLIFAAVVLKATDTDLFKELATMHDAARNAVLDELIRRVILPYTVVGFVLCGLGLLVRYSPLPEINTEQESETVAAANAGKKSIFEFPHLILGAIGIFLHVGTQVIAIDTIIGYANSMNIGLMEAKVFPSYTLTATICGYILGIICIPRFISQLNALRLCTVLGTILTLLIIFANGTVNLFGHSADISIWFVVLLGLANSLVWAGMWPLALDGLGRFTKLGASVMIMGLQVYYMLRDSITGWPGGKPDYKVQTHPERTEPYPKRVIIFSPHPDDDIISMGGTFQRLHDQGHDVHVGYQTSGNIAVTDEFVTRFLDFAVGFEEIAGIDTSKSDKILKDARKFIANKKSNQIDTPKIRAIKGLIRRCEAAATCRYVGIKEENIHFQNLPFYETGTIEKNPMGEKDIKLTIDLLRGIKPHQVYCAGDFADPHGTHIVCFNVVLEALKRIKAAGDYWINDCWLWLYKGAWQEWNIEEIEMAIPMSPDQVMKKRFGIFIHQSQKDSVPFQGSDAREFWQRAEERNAATAKIYADLGLTHYAAMEAFVRWHY